MENIYSKLIELENHNQAAALCLITSTKGSTPRKAGSKMIVYEDGTIFGTIGGGALENQVINDALEIMKSNNPKFFKHNLEADHSMGCGGEVDVYIEPIENKKNLIIFGGGHVGKALAKYAKDVGFKITIVDEREGIFDTYNKDEYSLIADNHNNIFNQLFFNSNTFVVVLTHLHDYDFEIVEYCAKQETAYLGMIGSKRKFAKAKTYLLEEIRITEEQFEHIECPMGVPIECETPKEIAISIIASLIDVRAKMLKNR